MHQKPETSARRRRRPAAGVIWSVIAVLVLALGIGGLWAGGGFAESPRADRTPVVRPGAEATGTRFTVVLREAAVQPVNPARPSSARGRFLVLRGKVTLRGKQTASLLTTLLQNAKIRLLPAGTELKGWQAQSVYVDRDPGHIDFAVQPGLPEAFTAVYELPKGRPAPARVEVELGDEVWDRSFLSERLTWQGNGEAFARIVLPVAAP